MREHVSPNNNNNSRSTIGGILKMIRRTMIGNGAAAADDDDADAGAGGGGGGTQPSSSDISSMVGCNSKFHQFICQPSFPSKYFASRSAWGKWHCTTAHGWRSEEIHRSWEAACGKQLVVRGSLDPMGSSYNPLLMSPGEAWISTLKASKVLTIPVPICN